MAEDWLADVRKYAADADEAIVAGLVRYLGIALRKRDSSLVSFSDSKETDRVRENFLKKKLALSEPDAALDEAIAAVGERMKEDRTKNRVTVYYLLAERFGKLELFRGKAARASAATPGPAAAVAAPPPPADAAPQPVVSEAPRAAEAAPSRLADAPSGDGGNGGGSSWWLWVLLLVVLIAILLFLLLR